MLKCTRVDIFFHRWPLAVGFTEGTVVKDIQHSSTLHLLQCGKKLGCFHYDCLNHLA
jgi:hypothetical protein